MKKSEGIFQKLFGSTGFGSRIVLRSNVYNGGRGYSKIGTTTGTRGYGQRQSPLLGQAGASNLISGYYARHDELKSYELLDISKLAVNFFSDYVINFLEETGQVVTILDPITGEPDEKATERINNVLLRDIKVFEFIKDHVKDYIFYGSYFSMLSTIRDDSGHLRFRVEELYDPTSVISKKTRGKDGTIEEVFLARGEDGKTYEIPSDEVFYIGSLGLRLVNDLDEGWKDKKTFVPGWGKKDENSNRYQVLRKNSYSSGEPLFYSLTLKVKELVIKEILISLISLRDLSSVQIFLLQFDKSTPLETANDLCARTTKLANNTNELASFLTSQFDVTSFIENTLTQPAKFVPDYNATLGNKNSMLPLDKLSDKLIDLMQNLDNCRNNVLAPLGIPSSILDSTSGSKWTILQQSERANSKITAFMDGLKDSVSNLVRVIYKKYYSEELDPSLIQLHISEKTSVEYNNQINQSESISGLIQSITNILVNATQVLDQTAPLIDTSAFLSYVQNLIKDIDPSTEDIITKQTLDNYVKMAQAKVAMMAEQQGLDPNMFMQQDK